MSDKEYLKRCELLKKTIDSFIELGKAHCDGYGEKPCNCQGYVKTNG